MFSSGTPLTFTELHSYRPKTVLSIHTDVRGSGPTEIDNSETKRFVQSGLLLLIWYERIGSNGLRLTPCRKLEDVALFLKSTEASLMDIPVLMKSRLVFITRKCVFQIFISLIFVFFRDPKFLQPDIYWPAPKISSAWYHFLPRNFH